MPESKTIGALNRSTLFGPTWHGPAFFETLKDIAADDAAKRPQANAHSIWEIVEHVDAWLAYAIRVLDGEDLTKLEGAADWPEVSDTSAAAWDALLERLARDGAAFQERVEKLTDDALHAPVPGADFPLKVMLYGVTHHYTYHGGQIALLRKALDAQS